MIAGEGVGRVKENRSQVVVVKRVSERGRVGCSANAEGAGGRRQDAVRGW